MIEEFINKSVEIILALLGSAGAWGFFTYRAKKRDEERKKLMDATKDINKNDEIIILLKEQNEQLSLKIELLIKDKQDLLEKLYNISNQLEISKIQIMKLETAIFNKETR